jgi:hypothetical protein
MSVAGAGGTLEQTVAAGSGHPGPRDLAVNSAILGFAAAAWFAWAQQSPPTGWLAFLTAGTVMGTIAAVGGAVAAWRSRGPASRVEAGATQEHGNRHLRIIAERRRTHRTAGP